MVCRPRHEATRCAVASGFDRSSSRHYHLKPLVAFFDYVPSKRKINELLAFIRAPNDQYT